MILYHGSNVSVESPRILVPNRALDFGPGFYTTSSFEQAKRWAGVQARRRGSGSPLVSSYEFDEKSAPSVMNVKEFAGADAEWLGFVAANRKDEYSGEAYDLVIGPVANDNTMPVINDYMVGAIDEETALVLLKPQKLADQYAFLTAEALGQLAFVESKSYD